MVYILTQLVIYGHQLVIYILTQVGDLLLQICCFYSDIVGDLLSQIDSLKAKRLLLMFGHIA